CLTSSEAFCDIYKFSAFMYPNKIEFMTNKLLLVKPVITVLKTTSSYFARLRRHLFESRRKKIKSIADRWTSGTKTILSCWKPNTEIMNQTDNDLRHKFHKKIFRNLKRMVSIYINEVKPLNKQNIYKIFVQISPISTSLKIFIT
ncbi:Hypothetical predicted protein, partial [Mytilus galloprovincialis]